MGNRVSIIAVTTTALFLGMKEPVNDCLVYELGIYDGALNVSGEYFGYRLPYDDTDRLYSINKELAMLIHDLLKSDYPEHCVSMMYINEIEELVEDDAQRNSGS